MTEENILKIMRLWAFENIKCINPNSMVSRLIHGTANPDFVFCNEVNLMNSKFLISIIRNNENVEVKKHSKDIKEITNKYLGYLNK